jgi:hypothetical protein
MVRIPKILDHYILAATAVFGLFGSRQALAEELCISPSNTYTVVVDLHAGELGTYLSLPTTLPLCSHYRSTLLCIGYFTFKECPGLLNPTIGIELGQTYMFDQADRTNWYHPMGFAYFPDGAHDDKAELEPAVSLNSTSSCKATLSCPTPLYYLDGKLLGVTGTNDFGLDAYEPDFFLPIPEWSKRGTFSVALKFDDEAYTKDIFYFCHVRIVS